MPALPLPDALFELDAVVAWPLGRGPQQWYRGASEQDALDVADDVLERLHLDHDRVMVAGMSMGGYGAFRLAQLYPDRWSLAYSDVGADQMDLLGNMTNLPLRFQNGVVEPLVNVLQARQARDRADAAGTVDDRSWILDLGTHRPAAALSECVYREALVAPRVVDPARVRYTVDPSLFVEDAASGCDSSTTGRTGSAAWSPRAPGAGRSTSRPGPSAGGRRRCHHHRALREPGERTRSLPPEPRRAHA